MKGQQLPYSEVEMAWLRANTALPAPDLHAGFCAAFGRRDVSKANLVAKRKRMGLTTGRSGRFMPGQAAPNKGKRMPFNAASAATRFRPGNRSGKAAALHKPIGTERMSKDGYCEIKVHDGMPLRSRWRALHLVKWEAVNGPLPKGMALKCLDGDRLNCEPANWEMVPRAILPILNGGRFKTRVAFDEAPADLKPSLMAVARLKHAVRKGARA
jgi:hypothetical protein